MKKLKKWIYLILWLLVIFIFSSQANSGDITHNIIGEVANTNYTITTTLNFLIRKLAHLTEYFILALLTISLLKEYTKKQKIIIITTIIFCFLYALTDEYHQSLVPGRSALFTDVLIDITGSQIATIVYYLSNKKLITKRRNK